MKALFTIIRNEDGPLSKSFTLRDGKLIKTAAADLVRGVARKTDIEGIHDLNRVISRLGTSEALTFGVTGFEHAKIVTQKAMKAGASGVICRDRKHFRWPDGRGVLMLDIDKPKEGEPLKASEFDAVLCDVLPWWLGTARMFRPSASAFISDSETGEIYTGLGSLRCYAIIDKAENIPFVGVAIVDALWKAGYGRIEFSAAGSMLVRCLVDDAVWQPERLDFAGPAIIGKGLHQEHFKSKIVDGADIASEAAIEAGPGKITLAAWRAKSEEVNAARASSGHEEKVRRRRYIEGRIKDEIKGGGDALAVRQKWLSALADRTLPGDFVLHFRDKGDRTVSEVLANPSAFDLERLADPGEPSYANDPRIAQFYWNNGRPQIHSHAHGGCKYFLEMRSV